MQSAYEKRRRLQSGAQRAFVIDARHSWQLFPSTRPRVRALGDGKAPALALLVALVMQVERARTVVTGALERQGKWRPPPLAQPSHTHTRSLARSQPMDDRCDHCAAQAKQTFAAAFLAPVPFGYYFSPLSLHSTLCAQPVSNRCASDCVRTRRGSHKRKKTYAVWCRRLR